MHRNGRAIPFPARRIETHLSEALAVSDRIATCFGIGAARALVIRPLREAKLSVVHLDHVYGDAEHPVFYNLTDADFYGATVKGSRFVRCNLAEAEFSQAMIENVAVHGSRLLPKKFFGLRRISTSAEF